MQTFQEQIRQLTERKYELEAEEAKTRLSPEEQVDQLKAKIKRDNAEVDRLQQQVTIQLSKFKVQRHNHPACHHNMKDICVVSFDGG